MATVPTWKHNRVANVFDWLDEVRRRPSMYVRAESAADDLEHLLWGYETALHVHGVDEDTPRFGRTFLAWVRLRRDWVMSMGWAHAVSREAKKRQTPLELFFELVDEYRQLSVRVVAKARLRKHNKATGAVGTDGLGRARPPPREIEIVQYAPEPLFLLRYRYASGVDENVMYDDGSYATSVAFAKRHALLEFGIEASQWRASARNRRTTRRAERVTFGSRTERPLQVVSHARRS